jgi:hypothetical protein
VKKYLVTIVCLLAPFALTPKSVHAQETASYENHATRSWQSPEASEGGRRRKKAREMKSIMSESDEKIKAVLTDDQRKKYAEIQQEMREEAKERRQARRAGS